MNFYKRIAVFSANEEYFHLLNALENKAKSIKVINDFITTQAMFTTKPANDPKHEAMVSQSRARKQTPHYTASYNKAILAVTVQTQHVFGNNPKGDQYWAKFCTTWQDHPDAKQTANKIILAKEKICIYRNKTTKSCNISLKNMDPNSVQVFAKTIRNIVELSGNHSIFIRCGSKAHLTKAITELRKIPSLKIIIQKPKLPATKTRAERILSSKSKGK